MLGVIGDPQVARATADALFRDDPRAMIPLIQEAINATLPEYARREPDGKFGSGTLSSLQYLSQDKNEKKYLDSLQIFVIDKIKTQETGIDMIILDLETNLLPS